VANFGTPFLDEKARGGAETRRFARAWVAAEAAGLRLPCTCGGDYWTSDNQDDREHAVELCKPCTIRRECLAGALARNESFAVWSLDLTDSRSGTHIRKRKEAA
jgi:WhiB family redox-sensing transcriptional regulator